MDAPRFQRTTEDFTCLHCGTFVHGGGYTNHCPHCLYSMHVDINPGDRCSPCRGLMEPVRIEGAAGAYRVLHRCSVCGFERYNKVCTGDRFETLLTIAAHNTL